MGSRTWIKLHCDNWIQGTLREEAPDVRGIWADLLALAGSGQYGDTGEIKLTNGVGYTDEQIAQILCIKKSLWRKAKRRLVETERIKISPRGAISITNWSKYQSEYERQKPYRERKEPSLTPEPKIPLNNPSKENEKEIEIESKKLQREVTTESYKNTVGEDGVFNFYEGTSPPQTPPSSYRVKPFVREASTANDKARSTTSKENILIKASPEDTHRKRITSYLQTNGASPIKAIALGTGIGAKAVNANLHKGKGKVFYHDSANRVWGLT